MIREEGLRLTFRYAAGGPASAFLEAVREGRLLGAECGECREVTCPPLSHCLRCGAATSEVLDTGPGGELLSWTELPGVATFGRVLLDGASSPMVHRLLGSAWSRGDRVRARFAAQPAESSPATCPPEPSILDLEGFVKEAP
jgi:uncharacterized OB-fold protein